LKKFPGFQNFSHLAALAVPIFFLISCSGGMGSGELSDLSSRSNLAAPSQQSGAPNPSLDRDDISVAAEADGKALKNSESKPDGTVAARFTASLAATSQAGSVSLLGRKARVLDPVTLKFVEVQLGALPEDANSIGVDVLLPMPQDRFETLVEKLNVCLYVAREGPPSEPLIGNCCFDHCTDGKEWHLAQLKWNLMGLGEEMPKGFLPPVPQPTGNTGPTLQKVDKDAITIKP
jgi:hypothetical protein